MEDIRAPSCSASARLALLRSGNLASKENMENKNLRNYDPFVLKRAVVEALYPELFSGSSTERYSRANAIMAYLALERTNASQQQLELLFRRPWSETARLARMGAHIIGDDAFAEKLLDRIISFCESYSIVPCGPSDCSQDGCYVTQAARMKARLQQRLGK